MSKTKFITFEERVQIEKLLKEGVSSRKIAKALNRSLHGIQNEIKRSGGKEIYNAQAAHDVRWVSNKKKFRIFTQEEIDKLNDLYHKERRSIHYISRIFKCGYEVIYRTLKVRRLTRFEEDITLNKENNKLEDRILALEGQMDFLFETLGELNGNLKNKKL